MMFLLCSTIIHFYNTINWLCPTTAIGPLSLPCCIRKHKLHEIPYTSINSHKILQMQCQTLLFYHHSVNYWEQVESCAQCRQDYVALPLNYLKFQNCICYKHETFLRCDYCFGYCPSSWVLLYQNT